MHIWSEFYVVTGGMAATLLGLLFVAVSINATTILNEAHGDSRRLAEQAFQNYVAVLLVSLLALFPSLAISEFGLITLVLTTGSAIWVLVRLYLTLIKPYDASSRRRALRRAVLSLIGFGMLSFATLRMALKIGDSRNLLAASMMILLLAATRASWELLLRIAGAKPGASG
jgi:hypothetical protein